jgi:hypothetical protein
VGGGGGEGDNDEIGFVPEYELYAVPEERRNFRSREVKICESSGCKVGEEGLDERLYRDAVRG